MLWGTFPPDSHTNLARSVAYIVPGPPSRHNLPLHPTSSIPLPLLHPGPSRQGGREGRGQQVSSANRLNQAWRPEVIGGVRVTEQYVDYSRHGSGPRSMNRVWRQQSLAACLLVCLSAFQSVRMPASLSVCVPVCLHACQFVCLHANLSASLSVCMPACQSVCLHACQSVCLPVRLSVIHLAVDWAFWTGLCCVYVKYTVPVCVNGKDTLPVCVNVKYSVSVSTPSKLHLFV